MDVEGCLFFAPEVSFSDLNAILKDRDRLVAAYASRISKYFLDPAILLVRHQHAFAAGMLLITLIDHLRCISEISERTDSEARNVDTKQETNWRKKSGEKYQAFLSHLPFAADAHVAEVFYENYRNGLVHEGHIKAGTGFSLDCDTFFEEGGKTLVNPSALLGEIESYFADYVDQLNKDGGVFETFKGNLEHMFGRELKDKS